MVEAELNKENEEEPCFDDPPEFVDEIDDEGLIRVMLSTSKFPPLRSCRRCSQAAP